MTMTAKEPVSTISSNSKQSIQVDPKTLTIAELITKNQALESRLYKGVAVIAERKENGGEFETLENFLRELLKEYENLCDIIRDKQAEEYRDLRKQRAV